MKLGFSQQEIINTAKSLGLPSDGFIQRRVARAFDLVATNKVSQIDDGIFRVRSQYEPDKSYIVNVNHGAPNCDCPDGERTINCKHRIAALLYARKQAMTIIKTTDGEEGNYWRRCWLIAQGNIRPMVYEERDRRLFCNCGAYYGDCEHKQLVIKTVTKEFTEKRITNECGSNEALELQNKLNGQSDSQNNNGTGAQKAPFQLYLSNPFEESESYDIDQIEGRRNGEVTWKLRNGEVVISYKGIMTLAEKHGIEFSEAIHSDTYTVIAKGRCGTSERVSGKPINGDVNTALELAKRNAARQLLPYAELRAVEKKAQLESEFDWQKAKAKCVELVGEANVGIIIHDLTQAGKLREDNPSHYDRTEWLLIYNACQKDAVSRKASVNSQVERDPKSLNRWSYNSAEFLEKCREAIAKVREEKKCIEANEQPLQNGNGDKRKLMMDKKLRTWLVEADGTKKEISCREICEQFESKQNPSIVTRLRAGIESGADISTVELN
ncbi:SWIM zinc finger family protein [bacterium]|nr:SWIM zinc finger family protein [bacterium]